MAIVFIESEKAFDNMCWDFMIEHLEIKISPMISAIYREQKANILVSGELADFINIYRGMSQGCPLSPLLHITTLEVLNNNIRMHEEMRGFKVKKQEYKLLNFADDLALILEEPIKG